MKKRWMVIGAVVLYAAAVAAPVVRAQSEEVITTPPTHVMYTPAAQAPAPGVRMRTPGPGGMAPTPEARPDLGKWWKNSEIASELGLTEAQINQIEQTFFDHRLKLIDLSADVQRNEARLQPLMEADQVDEAKISAQLDQFLAARSRLEKANLMMMLSIRKVLSVQQWRRLEEFREHRQPMMKRSPDAMGWYESVPGNGPYRQPAPPPRPPDNEDL